MKKLASLILAVVSTIFLVAGVSRAAGAFDSLASTVKSVDQPEPLTDWPPVACNYVDPNQAN